MFFFFHNTVGGTITEKFQDQWSKDGDFNAHL